MVLQGSWLIKHSVSLVLSCLDGVTSPLLKFHHRMGWNRWGSSEQPCPVSVEALGVFAQPGKAGLANTSQQDLPGETCRCLCPRHQCWCPALCHRPLVLPHWMHPGPRRAMPPPHCEKAKKPTPNYKMSTINSSPQPPFFSVGGWGGLGWFFTPGRMWSILWCCIPRKKPSEFISCFHR